MTYERETVIQYFKKKYSYIDEMELEVMYDCAYDVMLNLRYPVHNDITEIPQNYLDKHKTWILRAMQEHIDREGMTNVQAYSENGVSITFDRAGLSNDLINEIRPMAKIGSIRL